MFNANCQHPDLSTFAGVTDLHVGTNPANIAIADFEYAKK